MRQLMLHHQIGSSSNEKPSMKLNWKTVSYITLIKEHTQVDWYSTLSTLRETGLKIGYTRNHYKRVLQRFISWFKPEMNQIGQLMNIDQLARLLMISTMPANKTEIIITEIKKLTRKPGESLQIPMANLLSLLKTYYEKELGAEHPQVSKLLFHGLLNFTSGTTNKQLQELIKYSQIQSVQLSYHDTLEACVTSEITTGQPSQTLHFDQNKNNIMVLHSTQDHTEPFSGYGRLSTEFSPDSVPFSMDTTKTKPKKQTKSHQPLIQTVKTFFSKPKVVNPAPALHTSSAESCTSSSSPSSTASSCQSSRPLQETTLQKEPIKRKPYWKQIQQKHLHQL
jgi:hypothetical protein